MDFETWWQSDENLWVQTRLTKLIAEKAWNHAFQMGLEVGYDTGFGTAIDRMVERMKELDKWE